MSFVIGQSDYFGFGFTTINRISLKNLIVLFIVSPSKKAGVESAREFRQPRRRRRERR